MSRPTPLTHSKIPRPIWSRPVSKKASTEVKVQEKRTDQSEKARSDFKKPQIKENCHQPAVKCRRRILNDIQEDKPEQASDFNDTPFEPNEQALESILNNQGIIPGVNTRECYVQSSKRSSVYYVPPTNQSSMLKTHKEYMENMKALHKKMRQLNFRTPVVKKQDTVSLSTPNQTLQPSRIYFKIQPFDKDKIGKCLPSKTMSERKLLKAKNVEELCHSASKLDSSGGAAISPFHCSTKGKENRPYISSDTNIKRHLYLPQTKLPEQKVNSENSSHPENSVNTQMSTCSSLLCSGDCFSDFSMHGHSKIENTSESKVVSSLSITNDSALNKKCSLPSECKPLIPLSQLMTPTPTRPLFSPLMTPSTPKYSSVLTTNTLSTWALQDIVSTPQYSQMSTHLYQNENSNSVNKIRDYACNTENTGFHQSTHSFQPYQNIGSGLSHNFPHLFISMTPSNIQTATTPEHTPRAPVLSSCLKNYSTNDCTEQSGQGGIKSSQTKIITRKKLRWADISQV